MFTLSGGSVPSALPESEPFWTGASAGSPVAPEVGSVFVPSSESTGLLELGSGLFKFGSARAGSVGFVSEPFELGSGVAGEEPGSKGVSFVESDIESTGRQMEGSGLQTQNGKVLS